MKEVIEIIDRCAEGTCVSRPFRARTDDGSLYWIKGCGSGWTRHELCHELLAARLATALEIPIAEYTILDVPPMLLEFCAVPGIEALHAGPAFGSLHVENGVSLPPVAVHSVPEPLRQKILLFDWWIQNEDRILSELGGNVNLLWNPNGRRLTIIDHNNAFDNDFDESEFFQNHVFQAERTRMSEPFLLEQSQLFEKAATFFTELIKDFPEEWMDRQMNPGDFVPESAIEILNRSANILNVFGDRDHD